MKKLIITIQNIGSILLQDFINLRNFFTPFPKDAVKRKQAKILAKEGILHFPDFITPELCEKLEKEIRALGDKYPKTTELADGTLLFYRGQGTGSAADSGMLDISKVNHAIPEINDLDTDFMKELIGAVHSQRIYPTTVNAYINNGISGTRGYHIDNTQPVSYKAFLYLTDVSSKEYGPYSFIKGSQRFSFHVYLNLVLNLLKKRRHSTDMPICNRKKAHHCIAPKGTLILSNQNGIHRGLPQEPGKSRVAIVFNFMVVSKLNFLHKHAKSLIEYSKEMEH